MARRDGTLHMGLVSVKESRWTDLKSVVGGGPAKIVFAPDGQSLTYDLPVGDTPQHDVLLMDLSTHRETPLVVDRANDEVVGWTRAGTSLLFTSDRSGAIGLWDLPFADGAPGQARLIKSDLGSRTFTIGLTAAGALVYGKQTSTLNVYLAEVDFTTGHMVSPPVEVVEPYLFTNTGPDWSADGNQLVFASDRPKNVSAISVASAGGADPSRWLRPGAVQLVRWIRPDMEMFERPRWAPDGSITVQGTNRAGRGGFFRIDPRSGAAEPIVLAEPRTHVQQASWTSDGTRLVFRRYGADESWAIVARNIREMREVELVSRERGTALAGLSLSPDDKDLAYIEHDKTSSTLCVLPLSGGKARTLFRVNKPAFLPNVTEWTPEGSRLIYSTSGANSTLSFWSVPAQGGTSVKLEGFTPRLGTNTLRIHRDGRTVAFTMGNSKHEVWTLENFLPNAR
jgi:Tol biopolymer transport system component